jgi:hypothetical protein
MNYLKNSKRSCFVVGYCLSIGTEGRQYATIGCATRPGEPETDKTEIRGANVGIRTHEQRISLNLLAPEY